MDLSVDPTPHCHRVGSITDSNIFSKIRIEISIGHCHFFGVEGTACFISQFIHSMNKVSGGCDFQTQVVVV